MDSAEQKLRDALAAELSPWAGDIDAIVPLTGGLSSECFRVDLSAPPEGLPSRSVLRMIRDDGMADREVLIQNWVSAQGIPAPRVFRSGHARCAFRRPYALMAHVEGANPLAAGAMRRLPHLLAKIMAKLHALSSDGLRAKSSDLGWSRGLEELRNASRPEIAQAAATLVGRSVSDDAVICHGDLHPMNLLMRDGEVVALLDWELSVLGPREYDVARTELLFLMMPGTSRLLRPVLLLLGRRAARQFVEAYAAHHRLNPEALDFFRRYHVLRLIGVTRIPGLSSIGAARLWRPLERSLVKRWTKITGAPL